MSKLFRETISESSSDDNIKIQADVPLNHLDEFLIIDSCKHISHLYPKKIPD